MKLTQEQYDFFKGLDVSEAIKHGEGKVQFTFPHKDHIVEVMVYASVEGDIVVHNPPAGNDRPVDNPTLSMFNIPGTVNLSGPALLRKLYEAVQVPPAPRLREAWLNTPHVEEWSVDILEARIKFSHQEGPVHYELRASKSQEIADITTVDLLVDWERVHTFLLPLGYPARPTAQFMFELASTITTVWRGAAEKQSK